MTGMYSQGDKVSKVGGDYRFDGVVVAIVSKLSGHVRYVVEDDRGVLHIYAPHQLAPAAAAPDPRDAALAAKDEEIGRLRGACESAVRGLDVICDHFALHGNSWDVLRIKNLRDKVSAALRSREAPDAG